MWLRWRRCIEFIQESLLKEPTWMGMKIKFIGIMSVGDWWFHIIPLQRVHSMNIQELNRYQIGIINSIAWLMRRLLQTRQFQPFSSVDSRFWKETFWLSKGNAMRIMLLLLLRRRWIRIIYNAITDLLIVRNSSWKESSSYFCCSISCRTLSPSRDCWSQFTTIIEPN